MGISLKETHNVHSKSTKLVQVAKSKTPGLGLDSLSFRGSFLWNTLDDSIKQELTKSHFIKRINEWTADRCTHMSLTKPLFFYFEYIMFVNSWFELVLFQYYCKYQLRILMLILVSKLSN